jgi:DNA transformation protein
MPVSDDFLNYIIDLLAGWKAVTIRRMFGGAGLYADGVIFGVVADDIVYLKVDDSTRDAFIQAGSRPFEPYHDNVKAAIRTYYEAPPEILDDPNEFARWAQQSLDISLA